jgi:hypothetical protein
LEPESGNHSRQLLRVGQLRRVLESIVGSGEREVLVSVSNFFEKRSYELFGRSVDFGLLA